MSKEGRQVEIPHFEIVREIGRGANGTVYEARDLLLGRQVAVKVWNARGQLRALSETAKIAGVNFPLFVSTYMFGIVDERPYAVMELVPGVSGKEWMRTGPGIEARVEVWTLFSRGLRYLHGKDILHGDPHLGNLIVFQDEDQALTSHDRHSEPKAAMKLADIGTSEFWVNTDDFARREARLIHETTERMFQSEKFSALAVGLEALDHTQMLTACNAVVKCISMLNDELSHSYAYSTVASAVADAVLGAPVFDLDELYRQAFESPATQVHRVVSRLNGSLTGLSRDRRYNGDTKITPETRALYSNRQKEWRSANRAGRG